MFVADLRASGWTEIAMLAEYAKGEWNVLFDTSSWMIVSTKSNPRVFDVHVPGDYESRWTLNLIEHLCRMEDERHRLRKVLETIRDDPSSGQEARLIAREGLERCYHRWLVLTNAPDDQMNCFYCPICGQRRRKMDIHDS